MKLNFRRSPIPLVAVLAAAAVLAIGAGSATAARTLSGSVGPGFTITLKSGGKKVTSVKAGRYTIRVSDKSDVHNFHLSGPGVNRRITSVGFTGTKRVTLRLRKGTYRYVCDPHKSDMRGSFKVR